MALSNEDQDLAVQIAAIAKEIADVWIADPVVGGLLRQELFYNEPLVGSPEVA